ncbi:MAG: hypothetical protein H6602_00150 [Flavobacteriales bacterium]|nr:hypothetical protein [Flavobacteriales bacterium]MCB9190063.1 hypothetical protein [Flavobacteriales bacterium]
MKSGHKTLGILLILIGLLSNPWLFSWLFSNDGDITTSAIIGTIVFCELLIVILGVSILILARKSLVNIGLVVISTWLTVAFSVSLDRAYGRHIIPETDNLLFPAFSKAEHYASEFELDVSINNLGFRGPSTRLKKQAKRVVVIGDSFTFGWGVKEHETWIHQLSGQYPNVEFLNLGQGGNHPGDYVRVAKKTIPLLKPDVVFVCVLEGNDLHQLMRLVEFEESGGSIPKSESMHEPANAKIRRYLGLVFPNFTKRFPAKVSIQTRWKKDAENLLSELNELQLAKYNSFNTTIRNDFENGLLNPSMIYESLHHPTMFRLAADTSVELCRKGIIRLHDHLLELKFIAESNGAEPLFINIPNRPYAFPSELEPLSELGFDVSGCDTLDAAFPMTMTSDGLEVPLLNPKFPNTETRVFYRYDGHWNAAGNRIFAEQLIAELDSLPEWKRFLTL